MDDTRYLVVDEFGEAVNAVLWDGVSPWSPGPGMKLSPEDSQDPTVTNGQRGRLGAFTPKPLAGPGKLLLWDAKKDLNPGPKPPKKPDVHPAPEDLPS